MKRRIIALVAALALAGVGTFVLINFVRSASDRAAADRQLVAVYLVNDKIPAGLSGSAVSDYVRQGEVLAGSLSPNAVTSLAEIEELVAEVDIFPNEQLTNLRWITRDEYQSNVQPVLENRVDVPEGYMTIPISLSAEQALGGTVQAGQNVAIIGHFSGYPVEDTDGRINTPEGEEFPEPDSLGTTTASAATHIVLQNVTVVEVLATSPPVFIDDGTTDSVPLKAPTGNFLVTFALQPNDVERIVFMAEEGKIWLALQTDDDTGETSVVTLEDIFKD